MKKEKQLYTSFPRFKTFCLEGMERMLAKQKEEFTKFMTLKPEQKYLQLISERFQLLNRVPQYQIASYLGVKPETLSRIRARVATK